MLQFEEHWQFVTFVIVTIIALIYSVYMSVKDIKWENRTWWQKSITIFTTLFIGYIFYLKLNK